MNTQPIKEVPRLFLTKRYSCNKKKVNFEAAITETYPRIPWEMEHWVRAFLLFPVWATKWQTVDSVANCLSLTGTVDKSPPVPSELHSTAFRTVPL